MSCFLKISEKAVPNKADYSHGEEYSQINTRGEPKQTMSHLSHHLLITFLCYLWRRFSSLPHHHQDFFVEVKNSEEMLN